MTPAMPPLILASTSRYRAELLGKLGLAFTAQAPGVDEARLPGEPPERLVLRLAEAKARAVATSNEVGLVIGSDQAAVCGDEILGKPGTASRAREQLARLAGRDVEFLTSLCLLDAQSGRVQTALARTRVRFRTLTPGEIANYVARDQPLDCAGSFKSEGLGIALFESIEGPDPNALVGLPLIELCRMLRAVGVDVLG
jgi:septum formation protein